MMGDTKMADRYREAVRLYTKNTRTSVCNGSPWIHWEPDELHFTYEHQEREKTGVRNVTLRVNAATGEATEHVPDKGQMESAGSTLPSNWSVSPDGRHALYTKEHNLVLYEIPSGKETILTNDGEQLLEYGCYIDIYSQITVQRQGYIEHPQVCWSPDGRYFVTYRADRRTTRHLNVIESFHDEEAEDVRPVLRQYPCPFAADPDDEIPHYTLFVGDISEGVMKPVDAPDFLYPVFTSEEKSIVKWLDDSNGFYFTWIARGYQEARLYLAEASKGNARPVICETTDKFFNLGAFQLLDGYGSYLFSNFITQDRRYAFWQSERNGYAHLYRYRLDPDASICEGDLFCEADRERIVQKIIRVDEKNEKIYFMGNQDKDCSDPLYYQLYVVHFDGSGLKRLTPEDATHRISMGKDHFVDTYSRVDLPPVTLLRDRDGKFIRELEKADITQLMELGYQFPERFTVTAADGKTRLCGILVRPAHIEPGRKYPVIDYIYGGAQLYNVPREFTWDNTMDREIYGGLQSFAKLGFAGIILDGRGTPGRGMEIHGFSYHNIHACAGLEDHAACLMQLAEKYPFLDISRVGMWGNSAGGYATVSAMFRYPDIYQVGVASSGNYDQRMYEHSWTERYYGLYEKELYRQGDITRLAGNLQGRLMLAYGAMDDNVSMSQTLRLCDELNRHGKTYDLVVLPRSNHNVPADLYFVRRKMDFFVKELLKEEPPADLPVEM
ncbi:MAG: DPP IV N-terminal domain-containing protein [Clostridiales bacterium]|nr:DPP IV N-terminal domain-containing protein [Clostridiales bacterium]